METPEVYTQQIINITSDRSRPFSQIRQEVEEKVAKIMQETLLHANHSNTCTKKTTG